MPETSRHPSLLPAAYRPPTSVSYTKSSEERRGRRSGQVASKRCPTCDGMVVIDVRVMTQTRTGVTMPCTACSSPVPVRRADLSRPAPETPVEERPKRRWFGHRRHEGAFANRQSA